MGRKIHQLVAGYRNGDAISTAARLMRGVFRSWGLKSDIYCVRNFSEAACRRDLCELADLHGDVGPGDIAILHLSIGCEANRVFTGLACKKVIVYHNVTPSRYFKLLSGPTAAVLDEGRRQMAALAGTADLNVADSAYNAAELAGAGYRDVKVMPLPIDLEAFCSGDQHRETLAFNNDGHRNILFVGRFAPNKKIEDLVTAVFYLTKIDPLTRFIHVGSFTGMETYYSLVLAHARMLGLTNVYFKNAATQDVLNACYATAHAFLCLSEHEGFCAPLVEAMLYHVPVFSLASAAIPETLDGAGVLFQPPPDYPVIAETIAEVLHSPALRDAIVARQNRRVQAIRDRDLSAELRALLAPLMA